MKTDLARFCWIATLCMGVAMFSGCRSLRFGAPEPAAYPVPGPGWKTALGQLRYATPQRAVIGEAVVSRRPARAEEGRDGGRDAGDFQLDFVAGPGLPLMSLREAGSRAKAEGLFARGRWAGDPARAGRLASWMTLRDAFAALDAHPRQRTQEARSAPGCKPAWSARREPADGGKKRITVEYPATGERFVFVFAR